MAKKHFYRGLFALHICVVLYFWWSGSGSLLGESTSSTLLAIGRLAGLLGVSLVLLQVMLMGRARWLEGVWGLDKLARIHKVNGEALIFVLIAHPILLILAYSSINGHGFIEQYLDFFKNYEDTLSAFIGLCIFLFVVAYSVLMVRRKWNFEWWYISHLSVYLAILLSFGHQRHNGGDLLASQIFYWYWMAMYAFVFGNLFWYRIWLPKWLSYKHAFIVERVSRETHDVTSVYITGKNMGKFTVRAGQFFIIRFLDKKRWWQAHPFSMSKLPDGKSLRLSIKASGDFTAEIPTIQPSTRVLIEGPYGIFTKQRIKGNKALLIAGGIGITPIRPLAEDLAQDGKDIQLFYANKTASDIVLRGEIEELSKNYHFPIHHILGTDDKQLPEDKYTTTNSGFITANLLQKYAPDILEREIFLCGPPPMMKTIIAILTELGVPKQNIYYERFALA